MSVSVFVKGLKPGDSFRLDLVAGPADRVAAGGAEEAAVYPDAVMMRGGAQFGHTRAELDAMLAAVRKGGIASRRESGDGDEAR